MNLTKKQALELTAELWQWLAKNPNVARKTDWPKFQEMEYHPANSCFCCQFVVEQTKGKYPSCHARETDSKSQREHALCPLKELWPNGCEQEPSPYVAWGDAATDNDARVAAQQIADAAKAELAKL